MHDQLKYPCPEREGELFSFRKRCTLFTQAHVGTYFVIVLLILLGFVELGSVLYHLQQNLYGIGGDGYADPGVVTMRLQAAQQGLLAPLHYLLGAPFQSASPADAANPLWWYSAVAIARFSTPLTAVNLLVFLGFSFTSVSMYSLLRWDGLMLVSALIGALSYGLSPIRLAQSQEHFIFAQDYWFILEILAVLVLRRNTVIGGMLLGCSLIASELTSPYLGWFALIVSVLWFIIMVVNYIVHQSWRMLRSLFVGYGLAALVTISIFSMTQLRYLWLVIQNTHTVTSPLDRPLADLNRYSLRWWDFFLPFPENPILGPLGRSTFYAHLGADTVTEQSVMTGYIALILAIVGAAVTLRLTRQARRTSGLAAAELTSSSAQQKQRELALIAGVCIVAGVLFGLPPLFHVGGLAIPSPTYFAHAIFPEIRTLSRIDLIIQLGVAILAALGAQALLARIHSTGRRNLLAGALIVGILLEYTNVPPWRYVKLLPAPRVYDWLASLSSQQAGIIAQYPLVSANLAPTPLYAFYAYEIHHHPLFNGVTPDTPPDALRRNLEDPLNPTAPASFAALGVKTIVIDTADFNQTYGMRGLRWAGREPNLESRLPMGLQLEYVGAQFRGYRITAAPASVLAGLPARYGDADIRRDGRVWQRIGATTNIWVDNVTHETVPAVLWTQIHNNRAAHTAVVPGYQPVPVSLASDATPVALPVLVPPGIHAVPLRVLGPDQPMAGTDNPTPVTVEVRSLEPAPVRNVAASFIQDGHARMVLTAVSTDACAAVAGDTIDVALLWRALHPTTAPYTVFVHLLNASGQLVATGDGLPDFGAAQTDTLLPGSQVSDVHALALPSTLPPGTYRLTAGLYNHATGVRLATTAGETDVTLGTVDVLARSTGPSRMACGWG
ncbi:MAG: hypothetical protein M1118_10875 [Chloroflexi bacterium]|nr:hypothetical protein [Chloroflexota bacterium]